MTPAVPKADNHDAEYLAHCRDLCRTFRGQCLVTGERVGLVPHHVLGRRNGDKNNIVLCTQWLHCLSNDSYHGLGSYRLFDEIHKVDSLAEAKRLYDEYLKLCGDEPSSD